MVALSDLAQYSEKELLIRIASGDEAAFRIVFESYSPTVYKAALLVSASEHLAEEVVQDVFLKVWIKRQDLLQVEDLRSYLFIVARNQAYKAFTRQQHWISAHLPAEDGTFVSVGEIEEKLHMDHIMSVYQAAVAQLPAQQKKVFQLSKQHALSRNEVAAQMQISPATVKKYLGLAVLNIRAYCQQHAPDLVNIIVIVFLSRPCL